MGTLADSLFSVLMSWVRALVSAIWALFSSERTTILGFLAQNWIGIAVLLIAAGLLLDWLIWLIRWQPYHIWAMRVRRLLRIADEEEEEPEYEMPPQEAFMPPEPEKYAAQDEQWMPLAQPVIDEEEAQQVMDAADQVPDESLGKYPGMRYDSQVSEEAGQTRRFGAVHAEGPGAAEVSRRREEIDAWKKQMQEEARQKAQAERAARQAEAERLRAEKEARAAQEAYEAEQARLAQEAYEAEQARLAQEAYEAEQARLAREEYERQLAEYERQRAQYERDLAEYERKKAEYDAAIAQQQIKQAQTEFSQEIAQAAPVQGGTRRRRRNMTYSDYVEGDTVEELPAPPDWSQIQPAREAQPEKKEPVKAGKKSLLRGGVAKVAQMMEADEQEDVMGIASLPPRVDVHAAYKPAKKPETNDR